LIFQLWKSLFEYETWYLISENLYFNPKKIYLNFENYYLQLITDILIQKLLIDYENWCFTSKKSYLNLRIDIGSKPVTRATGITLEKDCKFFFPKNFYMQMNFWMIFFVTCCKQY